MKLPEKIQIAKGLENGSLAERNDYFEATTINQIIDYLADKEAMEDMEWQTQNTYAQGYNDGAYEQRILDEGKTEGDSKQVWRCGKCDQEKLGKGEVIPEHHKTCEKNLPLNFERE